jgi:hypothetical protein
MCAMCDHNFARFGVKKAQFWTFFHDKRLISMLFLWPYFTLLPNMIKKYIKRAKFATKLPFRYKRACASANFDKMHTHKDTRACARAIQILAKCTRACDARATENGVCECVCVRVQKSSQLTVWFQWTLELSRVYCWLLNKNCFWRTFNSKTSFLISVFW